MPEHSKVSVCLTTTSLLSGLLIGCLLCHSYKLEVVLCRFDSMAIWRVGTLPKYWNWVHIHVHVCHA